MSRSYHIVIAENTDEMRSMLTRIVTKLYPTSTISAVADGSEALQIYCQRGADLLIANIHMPCLDGLSLVRALHARAATIPILLLSSDSTMKRIATAVGADGFVLKQPSMLYELQQALLALLPA